MNTPTTLNELLDQCSIKPLPNPTGIRATPANVIAEMHKVLALVAMLPEEAIVSSCTIAQIDIERRSFDRIFAGRDVMEHHDKDEFSFTRRVWHGYIEIRSNWYDFDHMRKQNDPFAVTIPLVADEPEDDEQ